MNKFLSKLVLLLTLFFSPLCFSFTYQNHFLPVYQHYLFSTQTDGQMIEMDDGSIWKINYYHRYVVHRWRSGDALEISQTYNTRGDRFWISNKSLGSYVSAELSAGPIVNHSGTNHLLYVDGQNVSIVSNVGIQTNYFVDTRDAYLISSWQANQAIIVGKNNVSWFNWFEVSDVILINVEQNAFVRAKLL